MESGRVIANGDRGHAEVFLDHLKRRLVSTGQQQALLYEQPDFGSRPDYRIAQIGEILNMTPRRSSPDFSCRQWRSPDPGLTGKRPAGRLFRSHCDRQGATHFHRRRGWLPSALWSQSLMGAWAPFQNVMDIKWDEVFHSITVRLLGGLLLRMRISRNLCWEAEKFLRFARGNIRRTQS